MKHSLHILAWILAVGLVVSTVPLYAQTFDDALAMAVARGMSHEVRKVLKPAVDAILSEDYRKNWPEDVPPIEKLLAHDSAMVRVTIVSALSRRLREASADKIIRREFGEHLANALLDSEGSGGVSATAIKGLWHVKPGSLGQDALDKVRKYFLAERTLRGRILLMGKVDPDFCLGHVKDLLDRPLGTEEYPLSPSYAHASWAATLVNARKGNKAAIAKVLETARMETNLVAMAVHVFKDLEYVRQPEVLAYLEQHLNSEVVIPDLDHGGKGSKICLSAAYSLTRMLKGFPGEDWGYISPERLDECREWMKQQKSWIFLSD